MAEKKTHQIPGGSQIVINIENNSHSGHDANEKNVKNVKKSSSVGARIFEWLFSKFGTDS